MGTSLQRPLGPYEKRSASHEAELAQTLFLAAKESHVSNWLLITLQLVNFLQLTTFSVTALAAAAAEVGTGARLRAEAAPMAR